MIDESMGQESFSAVRFQNGKRLNRNERLMLSLKEQSIGPDAPVAAPDETQRRAGYFRQAFLAWKNRQKR